MSSVPSRCDICDVSFESLMDKMKHKKSGAHNDRVMMKSGKEAPSLPVNEKPDLVSEDDRLITEAFLVNFKRDYHVCPVGKDLGEFFKEKNIKLSPDEEGPEQ